jgi:carbonic anhydrase
MRGKPIDRFVGSFANATLEILLKFHSHNIALIFLHQSKNTMLFSRSSLTTLVALAALPLFTSAAEGVYSYDPASPEGPSHWGDVALVNNQCNGRKNSPIAVQDPGCTKYADYNLTVSLTKGTLSGVDHHKH